MPAVQPSWPLDSSDHLAEALQEQGATPAEIADLTPALLRLSEWQPPGATVAETQRLLARLALLLPGPSPVRQAIRQQRQSRQGMLAALLETARAQVSLFQPSFWLASAAVIVLGTVAILGAAHLDQSQFPNGITALLDQSLLLRAIGPVLAYLGTTSAFRGASLRVLEIELVCLASPLQLALARLVIVLGYDVGLGLLLSLVLWLAGAGSFLAVTLHWLMPLLLVAGLGLLLSLHVSVYRAAALAYGGWLALLAVDMGPGGPALLFTSGVELLLGLVGGVLLVVWLLGARAALPRLLPRV